MRDVNILVQMDVLGGFGLFRMVGELVWTSKGNISNKS